MEFDGRVALITGGASGIGRATALRLAARGAAVCVADRDLPGAQEVAGQINAAVGSAADRRAVAMALEVTDPDSVAAVVAETLVQLGSLHVLVCSAGVGGGTLLAEESLENWQRVLGINLTGTFLCAHHAAAPMISAGWGRMIFLASIFGQRGVRGRSAYSASKGGVIALMKTAAVELAEHGITVNALCPGPIDTPLVQQHHDPATRRVLEQAAPISRYGTAEEVAAAAAFLASEDAGYITGHALNVDGGFGGAGVIRFPEGG